jgi:hypothetical protein
VTMLRAAIERGANPAPYAAALADLVEHGDPERLLERAMVTGARALRETVRADVTAGEAPLWVSRSRPGSDRSSRRADSNVRRSSPHRSPTPRPATPRTRLAGKRITEPSTQRRWSTWVGSVRARPGDHRGIGLERLESVDESCVTIVDRRVERL